MIYNYKNINNYIKEERFEELIRISEEKIRLQFETLLKLIRVKDEPSQDALTDLLMVTGPSSSGKTTTANLLAKYLSEDGYNCTVISLDDYYYDIEKHTESRSKRELYQKEVRTSIMKRSKRLMCNISVSR